MLSRGSTDKKKRLLSLVGVKPGYLALPSKLDKLNSKFLGKNRTVLEQGPVRISVRSETINVYRESLLIPTDISPTLPGKTKKYRQVLVRVATCYSLVAS